MMPRAVTPRHRWNWSRAMLVAIVSMLVVLCIVRGEPAILILAAGAIALEAMGVPGAKG